VLEIVKDGELLTKPDFCPETVYKTLMLQCWKIQPNERITASKIKEQLTELLDTTSCCRGPNVVTKLLDS
jgi:hypothetical protein